MTTHRNELCACGSGKKTKKCCGGVAPHQTRNRMLVVAPIALIAGLGIYHGLAGPDAPPAAAPTINLSATPAPASAEQAAPAPAATEAPAAAATRTPQPPGPAPAGQVWSEEHGHWHDAAKASAVQLQTTQLPRRGPEAAPAGKVWSEEHGHWHDAPSNAAPAPAAAQPAETGQFTPGPQPPGPAPAGKVWSAEHGHWHDAGPVRPPEPVHLGTINQGRLFPRPEGEAPENAVWSTEHGHWHRKDGSEMAQPRRQ